MKIVLPILSIILFLTLASATLAEDLPRCLPVNTADSSESTIAGNRITDHELLARLVYAEGLSTGFADDQLVYEAIAWGVMNRVRLGDGIAKHAKDIWSGNSGRHLQEKPVQSGGIQKITVLKSVSLSG